LFPKHLDARDRVPASANPRHYLYTVLLYFRHVFRFIGCLVFTSCDHVLLTHASSRPRLGYESRYLSRFHPITLYYIYQTRNPCLHYIQYYYIIISVFGPGARNRSILFILHHVSGLRARSGSSSFCLAFICLLDWDAVPGLVLVGI